MAKVGTIFETATNRYTAQRTVGQGGSGTVCLVSDIEGAQFALKYLHQADSIKRKRFANELDFCRGNQHDNIIRVFDSGVFLDRKQTVPFYVMPVYEGTLRTRMEAGIDSNEVLPLFDQILSGVEAAHLKGVYHRDLKPENVLFDSRANRLVVADFGIAHFEEESLFTAVETRDQERLANFTYAAPEQRVRGSAVDHRADIFALGLILNEMFTRAVPLAVGYPTVASVSAPHSYLDEIVDRMIRHSPGDRYPTVAKIKEELVARGNAFVALQKLDAVRRQVVPAPTPDDPLGGADVKAVKVEYDSGELIFHLEPSTTPAWREALSELGAFPAYYGIAEPSTVRFSGNDTARIAAPERMVSGIVDMFKTWVASANVEYRERLARNAVQKHQARMRELAVERERAEQKARITQQLANLL